MSDGARSTTTRKLIRWLVIGTVFAASLAYVGLTFNWRAIGAVVARADLVMLLLGGGGTILAYFVIRTLRWSVVLRASGIRPSFGALYAWSVISQAAIVVTPFQSGEAVKIEMLRGAGHAERAEGYAGFVVERLADVLILAVIAVASIVLGIDRLGAYGPAVWVVGALGLGGIVAVLLFARAGSGFVVDLARSAASVVRQPTVLLLVVALTLASWCMVALGWHLCLHSIGVNVSYVQSVGLVAIVTLVNVASLIPGAVGVSEVGITECLLRLGYDASLSQAGAVLIRAYALEVLVLAALHAIVWRAASRLGKAEGAGQ